MMKLGSAIALMVACSVAHAAAPEADKDPKGYAKHFMTYWEGRLSELGLPAKFDLDKSADATDKTRARSIEKACDGTHQGLQHFLRKDQYKAAVLKDVKSIRIVDDKSVDPYDTVYSLAGGVLTVKMNLDKYMTSNRSRAYDDRVRDGLPSVRDIDRAERLKSVEKLIADEIKDAADDNPPRKVTFEVRWDEFKGSPDWIGANGRTWRAIEDYLDRINSGIDRALYQLDDKPEEQKKLAPKIAKISLGMSKEKTPLKYVLKGTTLEVTVAADEYQNSFPKFEWDKEAMRVLGIKPKK